MSITRFDISLIQPSKPVGALAAAAALVLSAGAAAAQEEIENRGPYYEDDAWYDVTEWFDGNDYNPTDEDVWQWDDETYDRMDDEDNSDIDDDAWYGFDAGDADDNWYYDYYDDGHRYYSVSDDPGLYEYAHEYYDYDGDGAYDGLYIFYDADGDGEFEELNYYALGVATQQQRDASDKQVRENASAKAKVAQGEIHRLKTVDVREGEHLVARIRGERAMTLVDLGPQDQLHRELFHEGATLHATGPMAKIGEKHVLIAQQVKIGDKSIDVERRPLRLDGAVKATRAMDVHGEKHLLLVLSYDEHDFLVDLGASAQFDGKLKLGENVSVEGVPTRVQDGRHVLMAQRLKDGEETFDITRRSQSRKQR